MSSPSGGSDGATEAIVRSARNAVPAAAARATSCALPRTAESAFFSSGSVVRRTEPPRAPPFCSARGSCLYSFLFRDCRYFFRFHSFCACSTGSFHSTTRKPIFIYSEALFRVFVSNRAQAMRASRSRARNAGKVPPAVSKRGSFFSSLSRTAFSFVLHGKKMGNGMMTATLTESRFY